MMGDLWLRSGTRSLPGFALDRIDGEDTLSWRRVFGPADQRLYKNGAAVELKELRVSDSWKVKGRGLGRLQYFKTCYDNNERSETFE